MAEPVVRDPLPSTPAALGLIALAAALAVVAPLLAFTASLALLGGAHVLTELRYVDARFAGGPLQKLGPGLVLGLGAIALLRAGKAAGLWGGPDLQQLELMIVAGLGALALPTLAARGPKALGVGVGLIGALGAGLLWAPAALMLVLTWAHNWTPVGFLADALAPAHRRRAAWLGGLAFLGVPLLLLSGVPDALLQGLVQPDLGLPSAGGLERQLGAWLPASSREAPWARAAFSAATFAQLMHYAVVIGVLPRIAPGGPGSPSMTGLARLPALPFALGVAGLCLVGFGGWWADFRAARSWYGVVASVHAWIEVPALLLALLPGAPRPRLSAPLG